MQHVNVVLYKLKNNPFFDNINLIKATRPQHNSLRLREFFEKIFNKWLERPGKTDRPVHINVTQFHVNFNIKIIKNNIFFSTKP